MDFLFKLIGNCSLIAMVIFGFFVGQVRTINFDLFLLILISGIVAILCAYVKGFNIGKS